MTRGVLGCLTFCYLMAAMFLAAAWYGPPFNLSQGKGLRAPFTGDLVYTTGIVVRVDHAGTSSSQSATPVVEYPVDGHRERFLALSSNTNPYSQGDVVPVAYSKSDHDIAFIRDFWQIYTLPLMMLLFASPFLALALWGTYTNLSPKYRDKAMPQESSQ